MAGSSNFNAGQFLLWDTVVPSCNSPSKSPSFYFQNGECWFELIRKTYSYDNHYELWLKSENPRMLSKPFLFTAYIDKDRNNQGGSKDFSNAVRVSEIPILITPYPFETYYERSRTKIGLILHGEVGTSLRLALESEKLFRISACKPNAEPDATSPSSAHLEILSNDFSKLLREDIYQDVEVLCEDHTFKAHKNVLGTRSKVFLAMLQSDMLEGQTSRVEVKDMRSNVCKELLHYMYTGKLPKLTSENARGLYEAGDRYNVAGLMKPCAEFLRRNLTPDNACEMLVLADAHSDKIFKEWVIKYIIDIKIPLRDNLWEPFCRIQPMLAIEVFSGHYKSQYKQ